MASIRVREKTGKLFLDFRVQGQRCREQTALDDTPANRRKLEVVLKKIEAEITLLTFNYAQYFPASANAKKFERSLSAETPTDAGTPLFEQFGELWLTEMQIQWRKSHSYTVAATLKITFIHGLVQRRSVPSPKQTFLNFDLLSPKLRAERAKGFRRRESITS